MAAWVVSQGHEVRMLRCPLWVPHQPGGAKRLLHLASFALSSIPTLLGQLLWRPPVHGFTKDYSVALGALVD